MKEIQQRLDALREVMRREHLSAFIFPSTDPHNGEYIPAHWEGRKWISGFSGSAGTAVVTLHEAAVWTDSRYFIAGAEQLSDTEFVLMKERVDGTPSIPEWLGQKLATTHSPEVGIDGMVASESMVRSLTHALRNAGGITLRTNFDPLSFIWKNRPAIPTTPVNIHPMQYAGETCRSKITRLRGQLTDHHADGILVSALDEIAWLLNLRGNDVHCNPVFVSFLLVTKTNSTLYIHQEKLSPDVVAYLAEEGIDIDDYENILCGLQQYGEYNILLDADEINHTLFHAVGCSEIIQAPSPVPAMKAIKNEAEIAGFHRAMLKDGIALVKFLHWLKPAVKRGGQTEMSVDEKLTALRASQPLFRGISFDTIAGYQEHGAIVHYEATPETDKPLEPRGFLLLDSGAQYEDGTTDITRTIPLGAITDEQRLAYTLVLKGYIQLNLLKFPDGATGTQLDALARKDMWREGLNYLHGTGHGVGSYLNVHEGPHQIRMEWRPAPIHAGMTVTDEPGLYLSGRFGVRIENTLLVVPYRKTEFGKFLGFLPLTLCPIDTTPILIERMTEEELTWFNDYHAQVYERLAPHLDTEERAWLKDATKPLTV